MPGPLQLACFDAKESWFYSKFPPLCLSSFHHLYPQSHSFFYYTKVMTIGLRLDHRWTGKSRALPQLSLLNKLGTTSTILLTLHPAQMVSQVGTRIWSLSYVALSYSGLNSQLIALNVNVKWFRPLTSTKPLQLSCIICLSNEHSNTALHVF